VTGRLGSQEEAPLYEALAAHLERCRVPLHVPAHKGGPGCDPALERAWGEAVLRWDLTEVGRLSDPGDPDGPLARAESLAAAAVGADASFFLTGGSSAGVVAMIMAACPPGSTLAVGQNAHRSVAAGCTLAGVMPAVVPALKDPGLDLLHGPAPETVARALRETPRPAALLVVSPTYEGVAADIAGLAAVAHEHGVPLLVDQAHGVHFGHHDRLPPHALTAGADAVVDGMHKSGGSLTQSAILHIRGRRIDGRRVREALTLVQSSSPSYLLLASLDLARRHLALRGRELVDRALTVADACRRAIGATTDFTCHGAGTMPPPGAAGWDPTRLLISAGGPALSARAAYDDLAAAGVHLEYARGKSLLAIVTWGDDPAVADRLATALRRAGSRSRSRGPAPGRAPTTGQPQPFCRAWGELPRILLEPAKAARAVAEQVPLAEAAGRIAAAAVVPTPPGMVLVWPGQVWSRRLVEEVCALWAGNPVGWSGLEPGPPGKPQPSVFVVEQGASCGLPGERPW